MNAAAARVALALAYPLLAHWASRHGGGWSAALALADLVLVVLLEPLLQRRGWAWGLGVALLAALAALARTPWPQLLLLAPPVLVLGLLAWMFGRTLRAPREALITRLVVALHAPEAVPAAMRRYARNLTASWAALLAVLAVVNAALALVAVPGGVLDRLGHAPAPGWSVPREQWSLVANLLNYGVVGAFFAGEYLLRGRLFPERPYRSFLEFVLQLQRLGPAFWRGLLR